MNRLFKLSVVLATTLFLQVGIPLGSLAQVDQKKKMDIEWRTLPNQTDATIDSLDFKGKIEKEQRKVGTKAFPIVAILIGTVAIERLASTLVNIYRENQTGVVVSKLQNGKIIVTPDNNLPRGCVIYNDGKTVQPCIFKATPTIDPTNLIIALITGGKK
jgi:hypothetical protein